MKPVQAAFKSKQGMAAVQPGTAVTEGQLLISGVEDLASYAAAKAALEERRAQLNQRLQSLTAPTDQKAADLLMKEQISRCLEILRDPNASMEQKHAAAHEAIDRCIFSRKDHSLRIFYRLFLPD